MFRSLTACCVLATLAAMPSPLRAQEDPVIELRIYTCAEGKLPALLERFENHTLRIFEKHGMTNLAYWIPLDDPDAERKLIYILRHDSLQAAASSWEAFRSDPEWQSVAEASRVAHGQILAEPPEVIYMRETDYSPSTELCDPGKVFELRIYKAAEGRLDRLHARFRDHTDDLFRRHGMEAIGYWTPISGPESETTLLYVLAHDSRESAAASWQAFIADPDWQSARAASEPDGSLLAERPTAVYMRLWEHSPVREPEASRD